MHCLGDFSLGWFWLTEKLMCWSILMFGRIWNCLLLIKVDLGQLPFETFATDQPTDNFWIVCFKSCSLSWVLPLAAVQNSCFGLIKFLFRFVTFSIYIGSGFAKIMVIHLPDHQYKNLIHYVLIKIAQFRLE